MYNCSYKFCVIFHGILREDTIKPQITFNFNISLKYIFCNYHSCYSIIGPIWKTEAFHSSWKKYKMHSCCSFCWKHNDLWWWWRQKCSKRWCRKLMHFFSCNSLQPFNKSFLYARWIHKVEIIWNSAVSRDLILFILSYTRID